jgi:lysophospholipase L1-like esterase
MSQMNAADQGWVRTWSASPQAPDASVSALKPFADATLRQVVRLSGGGRRVRVRFTNEYGTTPLTIGAARLGLAAPCGGIEPGSDRELTFAGRPAVDVPAGAPMLSDPVDLPLAALSHLSISLYLPGRVESCTSHGSDLDSGWSIPGDVVAAPALPGSAVPLPAQGLISAVEVLPGGPATAVVTLGDSLTDGAGATPVAGRLAGRGGPAVHVCNQGISGNRVLNDGFGASALARFDRDVLATPGLGYVVVLAGSNDIAISFAPRDDGPMAEFLTMFPGAPVTADDLIAGYHQLVARAHGRGVQIYAATLTPYGGADVFAAAGESVRQAVNAWIRTGGAFDAVLDFDAVWRDPADPTRLREEFDAGDHLHGNDAGYRSLADSVDLALFA